MNHVMVCNPLNAVNIVVSVPYICSYFRLKNVDINILRFSILCILMLVNTF